MFLPRRFDLNIEPIFAVMALYDAKEKKKISESFHLDCNPSEITHMLDDHVEERSMPSLSRSAIFNISYPSPDVFLIVKVRISGGKQFNHFILFCCLPFLRLRRFSSREKSVRPLTHISKLEIWTRRRWKSTKSMLTTSASNWGSTACPLLGLLSMSWTS